MVFVGEATREWSELFLSKEKEKWQIRFLSSKVDVSL